METKSRYEIIYDLETKKTKLLNEKSSIGENEAELKLSIERAKDDLKEFESNKKIRIQNIDDQLKSIEKSLDRLNVNTQKKK